MWKVSFMEQQRHAMIGVSILPQKEPKISCQCQGDLPSSLRFGELKVDCEGWEGSGDTNILHGTSIAVAVADLFRLVRIDV